MKVPNVVIVGSLVIDHNEVDGRAYVRWGSPAMFMSEHLETNHGLAPVLLASYGPDFLPYIDGKTVLPPRPNLSATVQFRNIVVRGRRSQYCYFAQAELPPVSAAAGRVLSRADIVFLAPLTPYFPPDFVARVISHVPAWCLKVVLPQGYLRAVEEDGLVAPQDFVGAEDILPRFDIAVLSDEDHPAAKELVQEWVGMSPRTAVVLTENSRGADIVSPGETVHVPTRPVPEAEIVYPIGLGDVFSAAMAFDYYRTRALTAAVRAGHRAARDRLLGRGSGPIRGAGEDLTQLPG